MVKNGDALQFFAKTKIQEKFYYHLRKNIRTLNIQKCEPLKRATFLRNLRKNTAEISKNSQVEPHRQKTLPATDRRTDPSRRRLQRERQTLNYRARIRRQQRVTFFFRAAAAAALQRAR